MKRGEMRRVPQGVPEIKIITQAAMNSVSLMAEGGSSVDMSVVETKIIKLLDKRYHYRTPLEMLEMKEGYDDYIMNSFIVMIQNHLQKVMSKGINIYLYKDTHQIDTEIVRDQKEYQYRYAIDEEDRYRIHFIHGVTDEGLDNAFAEAKQVIDKKIDDMFGLNAQIRFIKSYGFCPVNTQQNAR
jgi:hypothetical protein